MSLPIKETPVLTGNDAVEFLRRMHEAETKPITEKEQADYQKAHEVYIEVKHAQIQRVLKRVAERLGQQDIDPVFAKVIEEEFWDLV